MKYKGKRRKKSSRQIPIAKPSRKFMKQLPFLQSLRKTKPSARKKFISNSKATQLNSINTLCRNLKGGGIFLTKARKKRLSKYKSIIRQLASPRLSQKAKRQLILNQKGGFISTLLGTLLPPLISLIGSKL